MRTVRAVGELRSLLEAARSGGLGSAVAATGTMAPTVARRTVGLVPTMGALHEGHLSLIRRARAQCDVVVVSLFVNPAQFNEAADLEGYPRDEARDAELAAIAGADVLFAPSPEEVYPRGFATSVEVVGLTDRLEGEVRGAAHFRGVTTVVTKLLNMVGPDVACFGQKDAQQAVVIKRLVADLNMPVRIDVCPTVREADGLAMSSRNAHLDPQERIRARALFAGLDAARLLAAEGERSAAALLDGARAAMGPYEVEPEYVALVDPTSLEPVEDLDGPALLALAARVGSTRLIDNLILEPQPLTTAADAETTAVASADRHKAAVAA